MTQITVNGDPLELEHDNTVQSLIQRLELTGRPIAVEVNCQVIPRRNHAQITLHDGDKVEIVTLVGGG